MNNIQSNKSTRHNRRFTGEIMRACLLIVTLVAFAPSVWAAGDYGFYVMNGTSDYPIHSVTSEVKCMIAGYTSDELIEPNKNVQYYSGTSDIGPSPFNACSWKDSKVRYSFRDIHDNEFAHITVEDPNGSGSWRITSQACDLTNVGFGHCETSCNSGDILRGDDWDDPHCLYVK